MVWRINVRLLLWTIAIVGAIAPCLYFWKGYQVRHHAVAILGRADALREKGEMSEAAAAYHQYIQFRPDDAQALLKRAETFGDQIATAPQAQRAVSFYYEAVKANPDEHDARRKLAELLFLVGRYDDAETEARKVVAAVPDDVVAERLIVAARQAQLGPANRVTPGDIAEAYRDALSRFPGDVALSRSMAEFLRTRLDDLPREIREKAIADANEAVDQMVARHPDDVEALLARVRYRTVYGLPGADADLKHAREVAGDNPEVLRASAAAAADVDRPQARAFSEKLIEVAPKERTSYLTAATLYFRWNELDEAVAILNRGLSAVGEDDLELNQMRLRALLTKGDIGEARKSLKSFNSALGKLGARVPTAIRRRLDEESQVADAQLMLMDGKPEEALPILKRMAASVTESADASETLADRERRWRLLATAYSQLGLTDLAAGAWEELVRLVPTSGLYRRLAAAEWRGNGDVERSVRNFEGATVADPKDPFGWLGLVEARLDQQIRQPVLENRDWTAFDSAIRNAQANIGNIPALIALEAQGALVRNNREAGVAALLRLAETDDLESGILSRIAFLLDAAGERDAADRALDRFRKAVNNPAQAALSEVELMRRRGQTAAAIEMLEKQLEQAQGAERDPLLRRIISLEMESGAMRSARRRLRELRKSESRELWVYETSADLALMSGDLTDLHECIGGLKRIEGTTGTQWRFFEALRSLEGDRTRQNVDVREANRLLGEIEALRPNWSQTLILRGRIADQLGQFGEATENYELALRSGARNLTTLQWLVLTLYRQNRYADAASYIRQLGQVGAVAGDLSTQAIPANLRANRIDEALQIARAATELKPDDPIAQIWLAQTLAMSDKGKEAEAAFRKAIELAPKDIRTWSGLVWFLAREKRQDEARQALNDLVAKVELSGFDRDVTLARGLEMIGDRSLAEKHYRDAAAEKPNDPRLYEEMGRFFFSFDHEKSLEAHRKSLELDPKSSNSRRAIALLWGLRGSEADWRKAIQLLEDDKADDRTSDRRLEATLLLLRGGDENAKKAADLAAELIKSEAKPNPVDRLLLAKAYEDLNRLDEAQEQMTLVARENEQPTILAPFVEFLIRHGRLDEAEKWLARLDEKEPEGARGLELRLQWLGKSGRGDEIEPLVDRFIGARMKLAKTDDQKVVILRFAAELLTRSDRIEAAERKLREIVSLIPMGYESYAMWLADRGRVDDAVALCREQLPKVDFVRGANVLVRVLTVAASRGTPPTSEMPAIEDLLASVRESEKADAQILLELGVLRIMQNRERDAIAFYEQALKIDPKNIAVLNNISLALVDIPERREEALGYIDRAIAAAPNSAELLDTRALVLMGIGRNQEARELLEGLCRSNRKNARYRLHLAIALYNLHDAAESQRQVAQATEDGILREILTPSERNLMNQIIGEKTGPAPK